MGDVVLRTPQRCEDLVRGLCLMGAGGGGPPKLGLKLLLDKLEAGHDIEWVDLDALPDSAWTATVAGMGGRPDEHGAEEELAELGCVEEMYDHLGKMVAAVKALEDCAGVQVQAIVPIEIGGSNVPAPMAAAVELGLPVIDGDYGGGRAVPELSQMTPSLRGMPICPMSIVTRWGDVVILKDVVSTAMADRMGRLLILASYGKVGFAGYLMQIEHVKQVLTPGTVTNALQAGEAIRVAREEGADPVAEAVNILDGWLLFEGEITGTEVADEQASAFGIGTHELKGLRSHEGHTFKIWYKNEYHVSWKDDRPFVTSPDSLIMVDLNTGEPRLSYDFSVGDQVAVVGRKAHEVHSTERGVAVLAPRHFRFDVDYVPIEERVKEFDL